LNRVFLEKLIAGQEVLSLSSTWGKNEWSYISLPKYASMAWCSVKTPGQLYFTLWNPNFPYRVQRSLKLDDIMNQLNSAHYLTYCFLTIRFNIMLLLTYYLQRGLPLGFRTKILFAFLIFLCALHVLPTHRSRFNHPNNTR